MKNRGYNVSKEWLDKNLQRKKFCSPHNDLKEYKINKPIYKEHDAAYYDECMRIQHKGYFYLAIYFILKILIEISKETNNENSILNLAPLRQGQNFKDAIDAMVKLAKKADELGYERYWIAEHHNMKSVASSATQLLIQRTLDNTSNIRVGSGGVMLPNHSPYIVAEQYGTLETLYPDQS